MGVLVVNFISCGGSGNKTAKKEEEQKVKKTTEAKKEEDKEITIPQKIINTFGDKLPEAKNVLDKNKWDKLKAVTSKIMEYNKNTEGKLERSKVEKMVTDGGFTGLNEFEKEIREVSNITDFLMGTAMKMQGLKMYKMTDDDEKLKEEKEKMLNELKEKEFTVKDYKLIDEYQDFMNQSKATIIVLKMKLTS